MYYSLDPPKVLIGLRFTVPILCFAELINLSRDIWPAIGIGTLALIDVLWCIWQLHRSTAIVNSCVRDILYALAFYILYLSSPNVPGLILAPIAIAEGAYWFATFNIQLVGAGFLLIGFRMWSLHHLMHTFPHPNWPIIMTLLLVISSLFGYLIRQLSESHRKLQHLYDNSLIAINEFVSTLDAHVDQSLTPDLLTGDAHLVKERSHDLALALKQELAPPITVPSVLTPREQEVLNLMAQDYSYRTIAHLLHVSPGTVRAHVASIYRKADAHNKEEALTWAKHCGLIPS
ncbi:regulatory protein, luxR family [Sulfobacillus thermosulfidooxidans DSM 9293]|uniref:Regulatory protein, luxR family n=1 Tax=Sulfobacillus thermosulfidooxidans (strain DSM 9293 / VKM B-1269 / AT-1) TaxID=929705 RepID=A0A1W1WA06_SULTA|nr:LuxR family transcriptional regulator [Sulfobacillus thermosulfidooxidans]SMC03127.1 regulatory protein, luxR family [Sulfobacillus thermosulfidooxidans DSM 9293]